MAGWGIGGPVRRLEQAGSRGVLTSSAEVVLTLTAPYRFLNTYISRQPICLQKNLFFKACSHLPKENMSFTKKKPRKSNTDRQECVVELQPSAFTWAKHRNRVGSQPCHPHALLTVSFYLCFFLYSQFTLSFFPANTAFTSLKFLQKWAQAKWLRHCAH